MKALAIVEDFDVLEHAQPCGFKIGIFMVLGPLMLERPKEPLGHRVVVAIACAAHGRLDTEDLLSHRLHLMVTKGGTYRANQLPLGTREE
jgi:hypothetical protein